MTDIRQFSSFNDFFIRHLRAETRPFPANPQAIICPADGVISAIGRLHEGRIIQAKGSDYALSELCGEELLAQKFVNGEFLTVYLAPKNYHRVHIPVNGALAQMIHIPGRLFSVNAASVHGIPRLFCRNERVFCLFDTPVGAMAIIFVGALLIGSVVTSWHGEVMPGKNANPINERYTDPSVTFHRGDEIGYFQWGSTVIVLFEAGAVNWQELLQPGDEVRMGQMIGLLSAPVPTESEHAVDVISIGG